MKYKKGDRVIMVNSDGWAEAGQTGEIVDRGVKEKTVWIEWIAWDTGKTLCHNARDITHLSDAGGSDPNISFLIHKKRKRL